LVAADDKAAKSVDEKAKPVAAVALVAPTWTEVTPCTSMRSHGRVFLQGRVQATATGAAPVANTAIGMIGHPGHRPSLSFAQRFSVVGGDGHAAAISVSPDGTITYLGGHGYGSGICFGGVSWPAPA